MRVQNAAAAAGGIARAACRANSRAGIAALRTRPRSPSSRRSASAVGDWQRAASRAPPAPAHERCEERRAEQRGHRRSRPLQPGQIPPSRARRVRCSRRGPRLLVAPALPGEPAAAQRAELVGAVELDDVAEPPVLGRARDVAQLREHSGVRRAQSQVGRGRIETHPARVLEAHFDPGVRIGARHLDEIAELVAGARPRSR